MNISVCVYLLLTSVVLILLEFEFISLKKSVANPRRNFQTSTVELHVFKFDSPYIEERDFRYSFGLMIYFFSIPFLKASLMAQLVKNPPAMLETWVQSLSWEDPLEKGMATHSSIFAWKSPWTV